MKRPVTIVTIQPPAPTRDLDATTITEAGLRLFDAAATARPDIVCLPEYFNCMGINPAEDPALFGAGARRLLEVVAARAAARRCYVVLPMIVDEAENRYNRAYLLDRQGRVAGSFDKVHLTQLERDEIRITPGNAWPVFDCDFGRIGIMICYDGCFVESSRILAVGGAEVLFWPSLQRAYTREQLALQTRSHAYFNYVAVVRSSYGGVTELDGEKGPMVGLSCVCDADGGLLAVVESRPDWTSAVIDLAHGPSGARSYGGQIGCLRQMRIEDRRPETYAALVNGLGQVPVSVVPAPHAARTPAHGATLRR